MTSFADLDVKEKLPTVGCVLLVGACSRPQFLDQDRPGAPGGPLEPDLVRKALHELDAPSPSRCRRGLPSPAGRFAGLLHDEFRTGALDRYLQATPVRHNGHRDRAIRPRAVLNGIDAGLDDRNLQLTDRVLVKLQLLADLLEALCDDKLGLPDRRDRQVKTNGPFPLRLHGLPEGAFPVAV